MEKARIRQLISEMTLEEKASLCSGADFWRTKGVERLGIPAVMVSDGPHGLRKQDDKADHLGINDSIKAVCFPAGCALAASFDREMAKLLGETLGEECQAENVSTILGPAMNIKRSPLCGRNFEYYSEDPLVSGLTAAAITQGVQAHKGCGTTIKHYAANNQETNRSFNNSQVSERAMREIYLRGFGICVKNAQPRAVMTSYNLLNGIHTSEHRGLIEDILRSEFGFKGIVMTDWVIEMMANKKAVYRNALPGEVAKAGGDVFMPGCRKDYSNLLNARKDGSFSRKQMEINATRVVRMVDMLTK